ncbi:MAG: sulfur carrier protein ThiS [Desulfobacterales bacterium]|nr:sulfur carrier protein ThiS [Desulfobacterales bacterium]
MKVIINGEEKTFDQRGLNISDLLKLTSIEMPEMVSVQLNRAFVEKSAYDTTQVSENDEVDFLYFMGGGSFIGD